jgi:hypothetical protein
MRLLYLDNPGIEKLVSTLDKDTKAIKEELFKFCWYMRGGLSVSEAHLLSSEDREIISKIIEENLTTTKETQMPFF